MNGMGSMGLKRKGHGPGFLSSFQKKPPMTGTDREMSICVCVCACVSADAFRAGLEFV